MDLLALIWTASSYIWTSINKLDRTRPVDIVHLKNMVNPPRKTVQFELDRTTGSPDWSGPVQMKLKKKLRDPPRKTPSIGPVRPSSSNWNGPLEHRTGPVRSRRN